MERMPEMLLRCLGTLLCVMALAPATGAIAGLPNHSTPMAPPLAGAYAVACTNLAIDANALRARGVSLDAALDGNGAYVTEVLAEPHAALHTSPPVPNSDLYPERRGQSLAISIIACYPTPVDNPRPEYVLPDGTRIPHMQRGLDPPLFASQPCIAIFPAPETCGKWPIVVFSHGLGSNPVNAKSIDFLVRLASQGYIVAAPFHGDGRFSRLRLEDLGDFFYLLFNFDRIVETQALRPFMVKATVDLMLSHPMFARVVDAKRIGGVGGSLGGATFAWLAGADITCSFPGLDARATERDPRIKAIVGYVPYAGQRLLPAFGDDNATAQNVKTPYLAISGTADTTAPIGLMEQAMNNFRAARFLVALNGVEHTYETSYANDVFGWMLPFLDAYVNGNTAALDRLTRQQRITGGLDDVLRIDHPDILPPLAGEIVVDEYLNTSNNHYALFANPADKDFIDAGLAGRAWQRSGERFKAYTVPGPTDLRPASQAPVCRYYHPLVNTHFYSALQSDCDISRSIGGIFEGVDFWITRANASACPVGTQAITRLYNNRFALLDSNHRYTPSRSTVKRLVSQGWLDEGVVMCAPL
jgi:dienelactone hydrolase